MNIGNKFGKLTLIKNIEQYNSKKFWLCKCECGNEEIFYEYSLGKTSACSQCKPKGIKIKEDLYNKIFGNLTVKKYLGSNDWMCECTCGKQVIRRNTLLTSGKSISCGCIKNVDHNHPHNSLIGQRFGKLTVTEYLEKSRYKCVCDCGEEVIARRFDLEHRGLRRCSNCKKHNLKNYIKQFNNNLNITNIKVGKYYSDIFIPELNIAIDYNNCKNNMEDIDKKYYRNKFITFKDKDIHLITLFDIDDLDHLKPFFYDIFNKKQKVYARNTILKTITKQECNDFLDKYHLQGKNILSSIHYGLFYNNELISVMSFGNNRFKKHNQTDNYELYRFCVKTGITVIGGANKLLKRFEQEYHPHKLMSYSNNDLFNGTIYPRLGFNFNGYDQPRYFWYLNGQALKREHCQVWRLKDKYPQLYQQAINDNANNKEVYIMEHLGAHRVTRTGNSIWIKEYN